ncbi:hypothetical protein GQ44DRAFT_748415 [Phaeosphaeriaceae sp. PMI808]|nr:hypothetical protein GQ44DRAFT_748415 [Phaeosphaeriaceae sp. PMI808]
MLAAAFGYDPKPWKRHGRVVAAIRETIENASRRQASNLYTQKAPYNAPSDIPGLDKVVQIDLDTYTAWVEPNVTMGALVRATLACGLVPGVVAASKAVSVADAFAATTTGSSSFKFGTFDCTVLSLETILSNGQYVMAMIDDCDTSDVLCGSAGAMHSLGLTTLLEIALIPASEYVEITYWPVLSVSESVRKMQQVERDPPTLKMSVVDSSTDFVENIMFDSSSGLVITGRFIPTPTADRTSVSQLSEGNSFVQHARSVWHDSQDNYEQRVEIIHILEYLFRHDDRRAFNHAHNKRRWRKAWQLAPPNLRLIGNIV